MGTTSDIGARRLHLVDVENLCRTPRPTAAEIQACKAQYETLVEPGEVDHVVVACNHGAAAVVAFEWPGSRVRLRSGPDGADLALIEVIEREAVAERFESVVVASGDGRFADPVAGLGTRGVDVTVVAHETSLSARLRIAAGRVIPFDGESLPSENAALAICLGEAA